MPAAKVKLREFESSSNVPTFPGCYGAIVIPSTFGDLDPQLVSSNTDLRNKYTPFSTLEVGMDVSFYSADRFLRKSKSLWVVRAIGTGYAYAGYSVRSSVDNSFESGAESGMTQIDDFEFTTTSPMIIAAQNPGSWASESSHGLYIRLAGYHTSEAATLDSTTGLFTLTDNTYGSGFPVRVVAASGSTLPSALSSTTTYFIVHNTDGKYSLATSFNNKTGATGSIIDLKDATGSFTVKPAINYSKEEGIFRLELFRGDDLSSAIETHYISRDTSLKDSSGSATYVEDVLKSSTYVRGIDNLLVDSTVAIRDVMTLTRLSGGANGSAVTDGQMIEAAQKLSNRDKYPVLVFMDGGRTSATYQQSLSELCETRHDCVPVFSTPISLEKSSTFLNDLRDYREADLGLDTSFGSLYSPHMKVYCNDTDKELWVSPDGFVAAQIAETAANFEVWYPVAGNTRGKLDGIIELARTFVFNDDSDGGEADLLSDAGINLLKYTPNKGVRIWGQRTLKTTDTPSSRLNVRLLLCYIEPAIKEALEDFLFELNETSTRSICYTKIDTYMADIKTRKGVYSYTLVCDSTNNSDSDIAARRMKVALYVSPEEGIEEIPFDVTVTRSGVTVKSSTL